MKKITLLAIALLLSAFAMGQRRYYQYSIEGGYGLGISGKPIGTELTSFNVGARLMWNDNWGLKGDFGRSTFRHDAPLPIRETGVDYNRLSAQIVYNLGRNLNIADYVDNINVLAHGGLGYSWIKPVNVPATDNTDSMGHAIFGLTPQYFISDNISINADWSYIVNFSQHRNYDGYLKHNDKVKSFTGGLSTVSLGLTIYLGRNGSDRDWR